jgi:NTP pyrophosphatase (non-canonical NTP hydrolase)
MKKSISINQLQNFIKNIDYNPNLKEKYFLKLIEEVGELSEALRKDTRLMDKNHIKGTIEEELYDVLYYILAIANIYDINMEECIFLKEELNRVKYNHPFGIDC